MRFNIGDKIQLKPRRVLLKNGFEQEFLEDLESDGYEWNVVYIVSQVHDDFDWFNDVWLTVYKDGDDKENTLAIFITKICEHTKTIGFVID